MKDVLREFLFYYLGTLAVFAVSRSGGYVCKNAASIGLTELLGRVSPMDLLDTSPERLQLVLATFLMAMLMNVWRRTVKRAVAVVAGRCAGLHPNTIKYDKFLEQGWLACHYSLIVAIEVYTLRTETNLWDDSIWQLPLGTEASRANFVQTSGVLEKRTAFEENFWVKFVYSIQFSFYLLELCTLIIDPSARARSDAFVYGLHHVLTVFLISLSYMQHCTHHGILVLFFHDVGDIFLPIGKCFSYSETYVRATCSKMVTRIVETVGIIAFVVFIITFSIPRLIYFALLIRTSLCFGGAGTRRLSPGEQVFNADSTSWTFHDGPVLSAGPILIVALLLLYPMHVYWFRLIVRTAVNVVFGSYSDSRSDDEYEPPLKRRQSDPPS